VNRYNSNMPEDKKTKPDATIVLPPEQPTGHEDVIADQKAVTEVGGRKNGLDPIRYGDWEKNGRCIDF
jgi:hypothetical protein